MLLLGYGKHMNDIQIADISDNSIRCERGITVGGLSMIPFSMLVLMLFTFFKIIELFS